MYCLVNVDLLDYTVSQKAADSLEFLLQEPQYNRNDGIQATVFPLLNLQPSLSLPVFINPLVCGTIEVLKFEKEFHLFKVLQ